MDFSLSLEQRDIKRAAREFGEGEFTPDRAMEFELSHEFPKDLYKKAGELGFIGLDYPEEIEGGGLGVTENVLVIEEFCKADSGIGMAIHLAYLPAKIVKIFGTPQQHEKYLQPLVHGECVSAVSFTESEHGSDMTSGNRSINSPCAKANEQDTGTVLLRLIGGLRDEKMHALYDASCK